MDEKLINCNIRPFKLEYGVVYHPIHPLLC
jgi:hypothetical protein